MNAVFNAARSFLLLEIIKGLGLTLKYFFKPKVTINYPYEKEACRRGSVASMRCAVTPMARNGASPVNYAKRSARHRPSRSKPNHVMTAAAGQRDTISI